MEWWWGTPKHPSVRMGLEAVAIKTLFNTKELVTYRPRVSWDQRFEVETLVKEFNTDNPHQPYWLIIFRMHDHKRSRIKCQDRITMKITYTKSPEQAEPTLTIESHNLNGAPHSYGPNGPLCMHEHSGDRAHGWDFGQSTAGTLAAWAIGWFRAWIVWKETGDWLPAS